MALPAVWVEAPVRKPRPNTILDVIPVRDAPDHFAGVQYQTVPCVFPSNVTDGCAVTIGPAPTAKTFGADATDLSTAAFAVYAGVECFLNGGIANFREVAEQVLTLGEYRAVETQVLPFLALGTAITPVPTTIVEAIADLERALANNVPGQGYIFMGAASATYAASESLLVRNLDGTLSTLLGTPVVVLTSPNLTGIYASGPMTLWRGDLQINDAPLISTNKGRALAERTWAVTIECGAWKVAFVAPSSDQPPDNPGDDLEMLLGSIPSSPIPDGTDTTIIVQTNVAPQEEVFLWYAVNAGPDTLAGEMTQVDTHEFVWNVIGDSTTTGDSVEVWAVSEWDNSPVESNHITIEVT